MRSRRKAVGLQVFYVLFVLIWANGLRLRVNEVACLIGSPSGRSTAFFGLAVPVYKLSGGGAAVLQELRNHCTTCEE